MRLLSRYNPSGGIADFWQEFRRPNPYRWPILLVSTTLSAALIWLFTHEEVRIPPPMPEVTYITTFAPDRTDAEILAENRENAARQAELARQEAERVEARRDLYRSLGRATGLDVDAMERQIAADRAAEEAAAAERAARLRAGIPDASAASPSPAPTGN